MLVFFSSPFCALMSAALLLRLINPNVSFANVCSVNCKCHKLPVFQSIFIKYRKVHNFPFLMYRGDGKDKCYEIRLLPYGPSANDDLLAVEDDIASPPIL